MALTSFVGREREVLEIAELLFGVRLLTLTGPGGCGKTRLALHMAMDFEESNEAWIAQESFDDGVCWVSLASISDPRLVPNAVASAIGVPDRSDMTWVEALIAFLGEKKLLLIMDNYEHLVEACADLADTVLRNCRNLKMLATSREPVGISGEASWPAPPLSLPKESDLEREQNTESLLRYESVRLFDKRAKAASPGFSLTSSI